MLFSPPLCIWVFPLCLNPLLSTASMQSSMILSSKAFPVFTMSQALIRCVSCSVFTHSWDPGCHNKPVCAVSSAVVHILEIRKLKHRTSELSQLKAVKWWTPKGTWAVLFRAPFSPTVSRPADLSHPPLALTACHVISSKVKLILFSCYWVTWFTLPT